MMKTAFIALGFGLLSLLTVASVQAESMHVWEVAKARPTVAGAPRYSDVSMRSLEPHPRNEKDPYDTLRAARELHLTRLEWVYALDPNFVRRTKAMGLTVGGALSSALPDARGRVTEGRVTGQDGKLKTHAWFPAGRWVGCVNAPAYQETWLFQARKIVEAGADLIQQDDPHMAVRCTSLCYCPHCTEAFARYRQEHGTDGRADGADEEAVKAGAVSGERVDMGRPDVEVATDGKIAPALVVGQDDEDVGLALRDVGGGAGGMGPMR